MNVNRSIGFIHISNLFSNAPLFTLIYFVHDVKALNNLTASFCKGKKHYYKYYSCYKERNKNYRCESLDELVNELLQQLSFTDAQVARIRAICKSELVGKEDHSKKQLTSTNKQLAEIETKMDKLEEKVMGEVINEETYKKWYAKLSAEKSTLEAYGRELKADGRDMLYDLDLALPRLTHMHKLYEKTNLAGKQALLKKVFERGLVYDGKVLRTPYIHPAFMHNYHILNEKGLLLVEQPLDKMFELRRCTA